jgi:hypothetical protein
MAQSSRSAFTQGKDGYFNGIPIDALGYFGIYELLADTSIEQYQFLFITSGGDVKDVTISVE